MLLNNENEALQSKTGVGQGGDEVNKRKLKQIEKFLAHN